MTCKYMNIISNSKLSILQIMGLFAYNYFVVYKTVILCSHYSEGDTMRQIGYVVNALMWSMCIFFLSSLLSILAHYLNNRKLFINTCIVLSVSPFALVWLTLRVMKWIVGFEFG